jgi:DNA repair protein RecN (Recombination protein N)
LLIQLSIHNIAIVDHLTVEFSEGLNILTGETGAGKSIIIGAIGAVMGERMNRETIRSGCDKALVEAVFQSDSDELRKKLENIGIDREEDGTLIISREIAVSGKSSCRINGRMVPYQRSVKLEDICWIYMDNMITNHFYIRKYR